MSTTISKTAVKCASLGASASGFYGPSENYDPCAPLMQPPSIIMPPKKSTRLLSLQNSSSRALALTSKSSTGRGSFISTPASAGRSKRTPDSALYPDPAPTKATTVVDPMPSDPGAACKVQSPKRRSTRLSKQKSAVVDVKYVCRS